MPQKRVSEAAPKLPKWFAELQKTESPELDAKQDGKKVTFSVEGMELVAFARMMANKSGVSIVVSGRLDSRPVSLEVQDVEVGAVLALVARRLGVELTYSAGVYFIGELRPEDRGVYVRRVRRLDKDGLTSAVETLLSQNGRAVAYDDGLVVVGDRVEVLHRVAELLDRVEAAGADSWVIQLHLLSTRESDLSEFGLDVTPALDVAATFATASNAPDLGLGHSLTSGLQSMLKSSRRRENVDLVTEPLFVLVDGGMAQLTDGDELRVPRFAVSDFGTQTVSGFDVVQTGLDIKVSLRDLGQKRARLELDTSTSAVVGFVEGNLPTINRQSYQTKAVIRSGGVYLLGSMKRTSRLRAVDGILQAVQEKNDESRVIMIWARAYRIAGGVPAKK